MAGGLAFCDVTANSAQLNFDGTSYNPLPRVLAASSLSSATEGNQTMLVLDRIGGDLRVNVEAIGSLTGILYDQLENPYSFATASGCQLRQVLNGQFPRTTPRFTQVIPAGSTGWLKIRASEDRAVIGAMLNFNANAAVNQRAFNQGHNLHTLTLSTAATLTIPVFAPHCQ